MEIFNSDIFQFKYNNVQPKPGRVLVSEPFLTDIYFKRAVIFITEHSPEGTVGFVLNKPVDLQLNDAIKDFPVANAHISLGGPVNTDNIHFIHRYGERIPNAVQVTDDLWWGGDFDKLKELIEVEGYDEKLLRFFLGYSGWSEGQLENELLENFWIVSQINSQAIMKRSNDDIWRESLESLGEHMQVWANSPLNPSFN